ncbi:hypothetical protein PybrP1_008249 [[Pythium] brassicae (nom. inval.)]|nr:hypothetical protein PybrP1_008249 [[Pythium] brassicae (nom. inval.)]
MAGLAASVRVLLWKNWRVKQRESRLNRGRTRWLFPALLADVLLPLTLLLVLIAKLCELNAAGGGAAAGVGDALALEVHSPQPLRVEVELARKGRALQRVHTRAVPSALLLAALPLLLAKTNQSLAVLDREYRGCAELGIPALRDVTTVVPFDDALPLAQVDELLRTVAMRSGAAIFASLDLRAPAAADDPARLELLAYVRAGVGPVSPSAGDQMQRYLTASVVANGTSLRFPGILPLQAEANLFLRHGADDDDAVAVAVAVAVADADDNDNDSHPSPELACGAVHAMLQISTLAWTDFGPASPLGRSVRECEAAWRRGDLSAPVRRFLARLARQQHAPDTLRRLRVAPLPKRPQSTVTGPLESLVVIYMTYLFLWPYVRLVRDVVLEKEKQLKEYLLIMGLRPMALLLSWFLLYLGAAATVSAVAVALLAGAMFAATPASAALFALLLVAFASSVLCFGVAITPVFHQAKTAAAGASLLYFVLGAGPFIRALAGDDAMDASRALTAVVAGLEAVSSPVVFMAALRDIMGLDAVTGAVRPIAWAAVRAPCERMALQGAGYLLLGWYLENVFPRTYGVQQRWYFLVQPSYWFPSPATARGDNDDDNDNDELRGLAELRVGEFDDAHDATLREMPLRAYVQQFQPVLFVNALSKRYPNGKDALQGVSFGVQKGEIFGLLGPNGAGKSTTLSILCGVLAPTAGDAIVGGVVSVARSPELVRKSLSVCFQQNILFDDLSVDEHLSLVCALKHALGVATVAPETRDATLQQFGLLEKRAALAKTLSGGQKRKLSLVLALLDNARVVLLDEPTAGMDLKARLDTWDALKRAVRHRAVILTTHSMQEAQALCENIGIVADGRLKCCGSSLFLRERFGVGYKLTLVHHEDDDDNDDDDARRVGTPELTRLVRESVPNATVASDNKWETRFQLTDGDERRFVRLFERLEAMRARREIKRYAIAATDLEDVFVRVTEGETVYNHAKDDAELPDAAASASYGATDGSDDAAHARVSGLRLAAAQLRTLCAKRGKTALRDKKMLFAQYVWPLAIFAVLLAAVQNLSADTRSVETLTTLPLSAASSSFYLVSSRPELASRVRDVMAHVNHVVYREAASEQSMVDAIAGEGSTSFFAAAYISSLDWPDADNATFPAGGFEFSLLYNKSIARSLPVGLEVLSEAYCRARGARASSEQHKRSCSLAVKAGVLRTRSSSPNGLVVIDDDDAAAADGDADAILDLVNRLVLGYYLLLTISSIVSYYVTPAVKERESGLKRQQYLHMASRATSGVYWTANLLFDFAAYFVAVALVALVIRAFSTSVAGDVLLVWWLALVAFGAAVLPFTYLVSLAFASHSSAQSFMSYASLFQILATMAVATMSTVPSLCVNVHSVASLLQVLPFFTLGMLVTNVATVDYAPAREQCVRLSAQLATGSGGGGQDSVDLMVAALGSLTSTPSVWAWGVSGSHFVALASSAVFYWLLLLVVDHWQMYPTVVAHQLTVAWENGKRALGLSSAAAASDRGYDTVPASEDVERAKRSLVDVIRVTKVFNPKKAVRAPPSRDGGGSDSAGDEREPVVRNQDGQVVALNDVSFSVERNDCVALLGVNGSGKSTLFEILTAGTAPTRGRARIDGFDATLEPTDARTRYGYCPQTNILFGELTVREHLELFYRLRAQQRPDATRERAVVDALMARLDLFPVESTAAENLSGGNKRRVMLALSLLSERVSLLLLDEPSAGVDVVARRLMWRVLHEKRQSSRRRTSTSCLFTTHSMEEAEAVCANAVVLFKGDVVWSGSIPDLKQHASRGVAISLRLDPAVVLAPERVAEYANLVHDDLVRGVSGAQVLAESGQLRSDDLERAWVLCRQSYRPAVAGGAHDGSAASVAPNRLRRDDWFAAALSRVRREDTGDVGADGGGGGGGGGGGSVAIDEFVREWLIQEDLAVLEHALFAEQISSVSGEPVAPVDAQSASGSSTTAVYETACTDAFGLAALFDTLERSKSRFGIAQYSVSELSLERPNE